jgi:hypothetical protein
VAWSSRRIRELDNLSLRDLVKRQCTARLSTRRTTETITLPRTNETAHAITPYRHEGMNWVTAVRRSTTPSGIERTNVASLSRLMHKQNSTSLCILNLTKQDLSFHCLEQDICRDRGIQLWVNGSMCMLYWISWLVHASFQLMAAVTKMSITLYWVVQIMSRLMGWKVDLKSLPSTYWTPSNSFYSVCGDAWNSYHVSVI